MSESLESLRLKRERAGDLASVVTTMKALAASSLGQYEAATQSLSHYFRAVELGIVACFREVHGTKPLETDPRSTKIGAVVFGSDQGLVGRFNLSLTEEVVKSLSEMPGQKEVWAVGERVAGSLQDAGLKIMTVFSVPSSVQGIAPLVGEVLIHGLTRAVEEKHYQVHVFHNQPTEHGGYEPSVRHLLPIDARWKRQFENSPWPTKVVPETLGGAEKLFRRLVREYLFVSLFRACAESLMSENRTRLAAMQRAEKNIEERIEALTQSFHRLRQSAIDEELFDLISGYEALTKTRPREGRNQKSQSNSTSSP